MRTRPTEWKSVSLLLCHLARQQVPFGRSKRAQARSVTPCASHSHIANQATFRPPFRRLRELWMTGTQYRCFGKFQTRAPTVPSRILPTRQKSTEFTPHDSRHRVSKPHLARRLLANSWSWRQGRDFKICLLLSSGFRANKLSSQKSKCNANLPSSTSCSTHFVFVYLCLVSRRSPRV